ncbi:MAG: methanogenesis marker 3 protein [Candidatus Verstraetearchaeota archaeon]|nr:methanogenesis marker 3 protein [Candidatus Verstraetearchaeota archaeon]
MKIRIDGNEVEVEKGLKLGDIIKSNGFISVVKRKIDFENIITNLYEIITNKGKMIIIWENNRTLDKWREIYKNFENCNVRWVSNDAIAFGPVYTDFKPVIKDVELKKYDVTISISGMSNEQTHLIFSKRNHSGLYFPPSEGDIMGRIVYGKYLLDILKIGDKIEKISPVIEKRIKSGYLIKADDNYELSEGDEILTKIEILLNYDSPISSEHVYNSLANGFIVTRKTSKFIAYDRKLFNLKKEKIGVREKGVVSVRNSGDNTGAIYIYTQKAPISSEHNIVGRVVRGLELAEIASEGDRIRISIKPEKLDLLGKTQKEASLLLEKLNIRHIRDGNKDDDSIIIECNPSTTIEIYKKGEVICKGLEKKKILKIKLYRDKAPNSVRYFEKITGIDLRKIGVLKLFFKTKDVILFKGDEDLGRSLLPENIPKDIVNPGAIGVTNSVKRFAGMIGIRLTKSNKFGPTAEDFSGTNIIGEVVEGLDVISELEDEIYIMEES